MKSFLVLLHVLLGLIMCSDLVRAQQSFTMSGRKIDVNPQGIVYISGEDGTRLADFSIGFFTPTWRLHTNVKTVDMKKDDKADDNKMVVSGKIPQHDASLPAANFKQTVTWKEETAAIEYEFELPAGLELMPKTKPFVLIEIPMDAIKGRDVLLGAKTFKIPAHNSYGWGNSMVINGIGLDLSLDRKVAMSSWGKDGIDKKASFRIDMEPVASDTGKNNAYKIVMTFCFKNKGE